MGKPKQKWYLDWHVLIAFFFIGTGIGIPAGVAMLLWRAWKEYQGQFWVKKAEMTDMDGDIKEAYR